jgi:hypothetical protein
VKTAVFEQGNNQILIGGDDSFGVRDARTGRFATHRSFKDYSPRIGMVRFSGDGTRTLTGDLFSGLGEGASFNALKLWDTKSGELIRPLRAPVPYQVEAAGFVPGDLRVVAQVTVRKAPNSHFIPKLMVWDAQSGEMLRENALGFNSYTPIAFSPDGKFIAGGSVEDALVISAEELSVTLKLKGHSDSVQAVAFSADGTHLISGSYDRTVKVWEIATGRLVRTLEGHVDRVIAIAVAPAGTVAASASGDTSIRLWNWHTGKLIATLFTVSNGEWLCITPEGFFGASSTQAESLLSVVRGVSTTGVDQVWQSLYNPDLVREALAGDQSGEMREAAKVINLEKVLDSGPPPMVTITSLADGNQSVGDLVSVTTRIVDRGQGVGRIEWRVNSVTAAVVSKALGTGPAYTVTQQLALDPGDNIIEVVAYNASNLLGSLPARIAIKFTGHADMAKPKLHILAIGINAYIDKGWAPPGSDLLAFQPLGLAVKDATAFGEAMKGAAAGLYTEVRVTLALDKQATRDNLERAISNLASEIHPRDSFILFAAGHGTSENGRFYLIPQDYQSGPGHLAQRAVGQDRLQDWLANRIKARRALILLDTCESGALIAGHGRSRADAPASEAAVGRLHEATGRPVLTAAAAGQSAHEGLIGQTGERHGVFTWAVLDALRNGDSDSNGTIELSELVRHVQGVVPKVAAGVVRAATTEPVLGKQAARFGSRGEDFALARRLQ